MLHWGLGAQIMTLKAALHKKTEKGKVEKSRDKKFEECSTPGFALACRVGGNPLDSEPD